MHLRAVLMPIANNGTEYPPELKREALLPKERLTAEQRSRFMLVHRYPPRLSHWQRLKLWFKRLPKYQVTVQEDD